MQISYGHFPKVGGRVKQNYKSFGVQLVLALYESKAGF